ncbi:MAG: hypothetical protein HY738_04555 [Bacteroidia bacterium]|nr:hypothetical protein [Bacteroidia bacterium]
MLDIHISSNRLLMYIAPLIKKGNTNGYYPHWTLSFGEYYRSWHLRDESKELIAHAVLIGNTDGIVTEIVDGEKVQIHWHIDIQDE